MPVSRVRPLARAAQKALRAARQTLAAVLVILSAAASGVCGPLQLKYVVIVTRHGVRSPTWDADRMNQYSTQPWPDWGVAPGCLTPHGRALMKLMGAYYREWFSKEGLLPSDGCDGR